MTTIQSAGVLGLIATPPAPRSSDGGTRIASSLEAKTSLCTRLSLYAQGNVACAMGLLITVATFSCLLVDIALAVMVQSWSAANAQPSRVVPPR